MSCMVISQEHFAAAAVKCVPDVWYQCRRLERTSSRRMWAATSALPILRSSRGKLWCHREITQQLCFRPHHTASVCASSDSLSLLNCACLYQLHACEVPTAMMKVQALSNIRGEIYW